MSTVYIAGPIAGHPDHAEKFAAAVALLTGRGYVAVNPLDVTPTQHDGPCPEYGYHPTGDEAWEGPHVSSCCFMRSDIEALLGCDLIYLLNGWEQSRGATVEAAVARAVGIPQLLINRVCGAGCGDLVRETPHPPGLDRGRRTLHVYEGRDGQWYWRAVAPNGQITCPPEGHTRPADAERAARTEYPGCTVLHKLDDVAAELGIDLDDDEQGVPV